MESYEYERTLTYKDAHIEDVGGTCNPLFHFPSETCERFQNLND